MANIKHLISLFLIVLFISPSTTYAGPRDITRSVGKHPRCSPSNRPKSLNLVVTNNSGYPVRVLIFNSSSDEYRQSTKVKKNERKIVTLRKKKFPEYGTLQFDFVPLDASGFEIESLPIIRKTQQFNGASNTCISSIAFTLGRKTFGEPTKPSKPSLSYGAFIRNGDYTCCLEADGKPTYKLQYGQEANFPSDAIVLMKGFPTTAAMIEWICNRPVYFHYWASTWAWFNGYRVSSLPCQVNQ